MKSSLQLLVMLCLMLLSTTSEAFGPAITQALAPFRISIDGEQPNAFGTDIALERAKIQLRFDGLETTPILNITAYRSDRKDDQKINFAPYSNYSVFVTRAELRISREGASVQTRPLAVINIDKHLDKPISWQIPRKLKKQNLQYILRVYDAHCRFDETKPKTLYREDRNHQPLIGYGENHLGIHNIPISGGRVLINGNLLERGTQIWIMGRKRPVDSDGKFAIHEILPHGNHCVRIVTKTTKGCFQVFHRPIYIPNYDLFYTGLADVTVGTNKDTYTEGNLAFYMKGKMKNNWLLTASADTQEQPLDHLFTNFNAKDPHYLLRRLDPNTQYSVYGDDATLIEDAPTQGKFYLRLEKDDSRLMWGNFQTKINGTDLLNYSRGLYGANIEYQSSDTTKFGEKRSEVQGFAANPGTLPSLEEFRATGGSLYYLHQQDITIGSERIRIEIRDRDSGLVLQTRYLVSSQDYDINYIQGRITLREALQSTMDNQTIVQTGALSGNPVYLIINYEYAPGLCAISNLTEGAHLAHWFSDYLKLGVTGYRQNGVDTNQKLQGADATVRLTPGSYFKFEMANSQGPGSGALSSQDGGFVFKPIPQTLGVDEEANAYRAETSFNFSEMTHEKLQGTLSAYLLKREQGFSAPGQLTDKGLTQIGLVSALPINKKMDVYVKSDFQTGSNSNHLTTAEVDGAYYIDENNTLSLAVREDSRNNKTANNSALLAEIGSRTDAAIKLSHEVYKKDNTKLPYEIYGLAQATIHKDENRCANDRAGGGGRFNLNDRIALVGEITDGNGGFGGKAGAEYHASDRTSYYSNYLLDTERSDTGYRGRNSSLTTGVKSRYSDSLSVYGEEHYQSFDNAPSGLMHAFGLDLAANDRWTWGGKFEKGHLSDHINGDIDRTALSLSTGYAYQATKYAATAEWRDDNSNLSGRRNTWLMKNKLGYQTTPDWRFLLGADFAISDADANSFLDANYKELSLGYAYRPIWNDRFNALFKYIYFDDHASPGQVIGKIAMANAYQQRNQIVSADSIYDLTRKFSVGGKVGYRFGELRDNTIANSQWFNSQAWLAILRGDWHVVKEWDGLVEWRYLDTKGTSEPKYGALIALYRQMNESFKLGVGYNFTDFSDDLTRLNHKNHGVFINIMGKL